MVLTKAEIKYLTSLKHFKGYSDEQIEEELINLISNQNGYKELKKEITKLSKELDKEKEKNIKLKEDLKILNKKNFDLKLKGLSIPKLKDKGLVQDKRYTTNIMYANVHQLKRILYLLESSKEGLGRNNIIKQCGMVSNQGNNALTFMVNHGLIGKKRDKYFLMKGDKKC